MSQPVAEVFERICKALYVCSGCGATMFGRDIQITGFFGGNIGAPAVTCPKCRGIMEPVVQ